MSSLLPVLLHGILRVYIFFCRRNIDIVDSVSATNLPLLSLVVCGVETRTIQAMDEPICI